MAEYVLASDVTERDEEGNVVTIAKRGDKLPAQLKDDEEQYIEDGLLVRPAELAKWEDEMAADVNVTGAQAQAIRDRAEFVDEEGEDVVKEREELAESAPQISTPQPAKVESATPKETRAAKLPENKNAK